MDEENYKDYFSSLDLLENSKHQDIALPKTNQLDLNLALSLGGSYATRAPPESGVILRTFSLNGTSYTAKYNQFGDSCGQQQSLARAVSLPPDVEAETRRTKARNMMEGMNRSLEKKKGFRSLIQIPEEGEELEEIVEVRDEEGRIGNWVVDSVTKNADFCRAMEKLKSIPGPENSKAARAATIYHPIANSEANEIGKSDYYYQNGNNSNGNPPKKAKISSYSGDSTTMRLMRQMPSVISVGPTGAKIEGVLFKFGSVEKIVMVCLCHGGFFSAAEFVRHAGWADVANPMHHIKVLAPEL